MKFEERERRMDGHFHTIYFYLFNLRFEHLTLKEKGEIAALWCEPLK